MAGGTTTAALALAVQDAGGLAFAAGGYKTAQGLAEHLAPLRAAGGEFGVNLFVPPLAPPGVRELVELARYREQLLDVATRLGAELPEVNLAPDDPLVQDFFVDKIELLLADPVPLVSFTFGLPPRPVVSALHRAGSLVVLSVTSVAEALAAADAGADALVVQHTNAGGHTAAFLPPEAATAGLELAGLTAAVHAAVKLPLVAAGGIGDPATAKLALAAGAQAVQIGTALLRTDESGARAVHKDALADPHFTQTALTGAFTGKMARALVNDFVREHSAQTPPLYPEVHFLTAPLRAAAASAQDPQGLNLWAGTQWRKAPGGPAADVVRSFLASL